MISVVILTKNEENDIRACLDSVSFCSDVHVFDSFSTDRTVELARTAGAHVLQRRFDSYAAQRNAALAACPFKYSWVFILDCDERLNPAVWEEACEATASAPDTVDAFRIRRDDHFLGRHLKHTQMMAFYTRLVRVGRVRYTR